MKLTQIKKKMLTVQNESSLAMSALMDLATKTFQKDMVAKKPLIDAMVSALEKSKDLTNVQNDDFYHTYARVDFSTLIDIDDELERDLLKTYMSETHFIDVDFKDDVVTTSIGPCLALDREGDVYDQDHAGRVVIKRTDYENEEELKALIESHMEKTGHFPSVVKVDYHGGAEFYDTRPEGLRKIIQDAAAAYEAQNESID